MSCRLCIYNVFYFQRMRFIPSEKEIQFRILKKEGMNLQLLKIYRKELYKICVI